jgi:hypothetical protein
MIRRTLMRRAYNKGYWINARFQASKIIDSPKEQQLARSVMIRSHWNEGNYHEVIRLNSLWENAFPKLSELAVYSLNEQMPGNEKTHHPRILEMHESQPTPNNSGQDWNSQDMALNFLQKGNRLWMVHPHGWTYWDIPDDFVLAATHPDLLRLTAEILLYPWQKSTRTSLEGTRKLGTLPSLAFSAGTDSTAAALVMPKNTILGYHRRDFESILDHRNADRMLEYMESEQAKTVIDISSNHELIRTYHFKQIGFSSDFACATHLILLADHFDIGAIAFGMPLDNTWLAKGRKFRQFQETHYFQYWTERFLKVGIDLLFPIAGISEAGAMEICQKENVLPHLNSCLRGDGVNGCGVCWKCFLKNAPLNRPFDINAKEIQIFLKRRPLPTATHALWTLQHLQLESKVPELSELSEYLKQDLSWWTSYYPPAKNILQERWQDEIWNNISNSLSPMKQPYPVESIHYFED